MAAQQTAHLIASLSTPSMVSAAARSILSLPGLTASQQALEDAGFELFQHAVYHPDRVGLVAALLVELSRVSLGIGPAAAPPDTSEQASAARSLLSFVLGYCQQGMAIPLPADGACWVKAWLADRHALLCGVAPPPSSAHPQRSPRPTPPAPPPPPRSKR